MTRILIADDHQMVRDGLCRLIKEQPSMRVVGEASSAAETLEMCRRLEPEVVLLDLVMRGWDSLDILRDLKRQNPDVSVLMLSALPEQTYAMRCLRAGADGYLSKTAAGAELVRAIEKMCRTGKYINKTVATLLAVDIGKSHSRPMHDRLSHRELQIMRLVASGSSPAEIAKQLQLSVKTVATYRARVLRKTDLRNSSEIVRYAVKHGLAA